LSGLSPFLDDSQEETCSNIIRVDYSFPDEFFGIISKEAQTFILDILVEDIDNRPTAHKCLESSWIQKYCSNASSQPRHKSIPTDRLKDFIERKKLQSTELYS
ncbi:kalirin, partial [Mytilus galloprovincialis]